MSMFFLDLKNLFTAKSRNTSPKHIIMDEVQSEKNEEFTSYLKETLKGIKWSK